jgi:hypothetical protein
MDPSGWAMGSQDATNPRAPRGEREGLRGLSPHGTPRGEEPVAPPRASLGHAPERRDVWVCCGLDWQRREEYDEHLRLSHGGDRRAQHAPGGSGQALDARRGR